MKRIRIAVACVIIVGTGLGGAIYAAQAGSASGRAHPVLPRPPWVRDDGSVDLSKMPAQMPVAGPDGKIVGTVKPGSTPPDYIGPQRPPGVVDGK